MAEESNHAGHIGPRVTSIIIEIKDAISSNIGFHTSISRYHEFNTDFSRFEKTQTLYTSKPSGSRGAVDDGNYPAYLTAQRDAFSKYLSTQTYVTGAAEASAIKINFDKINSLNNQLYFLTKKTIEISGSFSGSDGATASAIKPSSFGTGSTGSSLTTTTTTTTSTKSSTSMSLVTMTSVETTHSSKTTSSASASSTQNGAIETKGMGLIAGAVAGLLAAAAVI